MGRGDSDLLTAAAKLAAELESGALAASARAAQLDHQQRLGAETRLAAAQQVLLFCCFEWVSPQQQRLLSAMFYSRYSLRSQVEAEDCPTTVLNSIRQHFNHVELTPSWCHERQ